MRAIYYEQKRKVIIICAILSLKHVISIEDADDGLYIV